MASHDRTTYAVGAFTLADNFGVNGIVGFEDTNWFALGSGLPTFGLSVVTRGTELFVGHNQGISRWDGDNWTQMGHGLAGTVRTVALLGTDLYAGGSFSNSGDTALSYIARWDGTKWWPLGEGVDQPVQVLSVFGDDLYVGGNFTRAGAAPASHIAKWNGSAWSEVGGGVTGGVNYGGSPDESAASIYALTTAADGTLYAGGDFTMAGHKACSFIARWDGTNWSNLGSGANTFVRALAVKDASLFVGGDFSSLGAKQSLRFGRWHITRPTLSPAAFAPASAATGSTVEYNLRIRNPGSSPASNCVVRAKIPAGTSSPSVSGGGIIADAMVSWNVDLAPDGETNLTFSVRVDAQRGFLMLEKCSVTDGVGRAYFATPVYTTISGNTGPALSVIEPAPASVFPILSDVTLTLTADDPDGVRQVDFYQGAAWLRSIFAPPYSLTLTNQRAGMQSVTAIASDAFGGTTATNITFEIARPVNDNFADRIALMGASATASGLNFDATTEPGEPNHDGFWKVNSVWWTWHAPAGGRLTLDTGGSDFLHVLVVYTGNTVSNLTGIAADKCSAGPTTSRVAFNVTAGTDHQICVDGGYPFTEGHVMLNLAFDSAPQITIAAPADPAAFAGPVAVPVSLETADLDGTVTRIEPFLDALSAGPVSGPPFDFVLPTIAGGTFALTVVATDNSGQQTTSGAVTVDVSLANNDFADRVALSGYRFRAFGTTVGAGAETDEPEGGRRSVWWEWTAPVSAVVTIAADSPPMSSGISVFTGTNISDLVLIAGRGDGLNHNEISFNAIAGMAYVIAVDGHHFSSGTTSGNYRLTGYVNGLEGVRLEPRISVGQRFSLRAEGLAGMRFVLQSSTDLNNWSDVATNLLSASTTDMQISNPPAEPIQFYRMLWRSALSASRQTRD